MKTFYPRARATEPVELAVLVVRLCKRDNIKPKDLAERASMTQRHFSVVTSGKESVPKHTAEDVARALEISEEFTKYFEVIEDPKRVARPAAANATPPPTVRPGRPKKSSDKSAAA